MDRAIPSETQKRPQGLKSNDSDESRVKISRHDQQPPKHPLPSSSDLPAELACTSFQAVDAAANSSPELAVERGDEVNTAMNQEHEHKVLPNDNKLAANSLKLKTSKLMKNSIVLEKIAKQLPVGSLLTLRETCERWNLDFIPSIKKNHSPIRLDTDTHTEVAATASTLDTSESASGTDPPMQTMNNFIEILGSSEDIPFTRFQFGPHLGSASNGSSTEQKNRDRQSFREFLSKFGNTNTIKSLELNWARPADFSVRQLRETIFQLTPNLEELIISACVIYGMEESSLDDDQFPVSVLPKLRKLKVNVDLSGNVLVRRENLDQPFDSFSRLMVDVIQSAVELKYLDLNDGSDDTVFIGAMIIAGLLLNDTTLAHIHKLKTLKTNYLTSSDLEALTALSETSVNDRDGVDGSNALCLSSFSTSALVLTEDEAEEEPEEYFWLLHAFLVNQSPTLKELEVHFALGIISVAGTVATPLVPCKLPRMAHLKKLKLSSCGLGQADLLFDGDEDGDDDAIEERFMDTFPKLEQFSYEYDESEYLLHLANAVERFYHSGVKTLELDTCLSHYMGFINFQPVFPSLTRLDLKLTSFDQDQDRTHIDAKEFGRIWTTWPALEVVHVSWRVEDLDLDLDALVTGVSRKGLERLKYEHEQRADYKMETTSPLESLHSTVNKYKSCAGIRELKRLREFTMNFDGEDKPQLTNVGGYFGIALASPTLQKLVIQGNGKNLVSERCLKFIQSTLGPFVVICL